MDFNLLTGWIVGYGLRIVTALLILVIGWWLAGLAARVLRRGLQRAEIDPGVVSFTGHLVYWAVILFAGLAALSRLGIETTSIIAVLGAAGLAVGLALQGALSNFAAGVLILIFRPYRVGDLVEVAGATGVVSEIQIFNTVLVTPDNVTIIVPNTQATGGKIVNYSARGIRRVDMVFGIGYDDDIQKARQILLDILTSHPKVLEDPAPTVAVMELADSSVNFAVRPFVKVEDYWGVWFDVTEQVKLRFDQEGISIPFPQRDVHLFQPA
ncbi:MAG: mechanosensitive ion channel family protein [Chloroflexi bacterium]|nr:MAG: mechanosensitive ion channel family protein [Chloroflexota bacterium]